MVAFQYRMPAGINGAANRVHDATIEAQIIDTTNPPLFYGSGLVMDPVLGAVRPPIAGDTAIYGLYVRPYPTQASQDPLGTDSPATSGVANVMKRGYMTVHLRGTGVTVTKGQPAFVWIAAAGAGQVPGGITNDATPASVLPLPGAYFMGPADSGGMTEIAYNI